MFDNKALRFGLLCAPLLLACPRLAGFDDPDEGGQCQALGEVCTLGANDCCADLYCPSFVYGDPTCTAQNEDGQYCGDNTECLGGACVENVCGPPASEGETGPSDEDSTSGEDEGGGEGGTGESPGDGDGDGVCLELGQACEGGGCCADLFCPQFFGYVPPACQPKLQDGEYCVDAGECVSGECIENLCVTPACIAQGDPCQGNGAPCCDGYCNDFDYGGTFCLPFAQPGDYCVVGTQCASGVCTDFTCT